MNSAKLKAQLQQFLKRFIAMRVPLFLLLVAGVYGFVVWRISVLQDAQPSSSSVNAQVQAAPHIDPTTISKVKQLQDNSVSVQTLFNQARQNPFQE
jgi:nitrate reductase NapE component